MIRQVQLGAVAVVLWTASAAATLPRDPRSHELLRVDCVTGSQRSDLTLFANGTLRLREGEVGSESLQLTELDPDSVEAFIRRLQAESLGFGARQPDGRGGSGKGGRLDGRWLEACRLTVDVPDGPVGEVEYGNLERQSLELSRILAIANDLGALARSRTAVSGLAGGYLPAAGDILIERSGSRYRVRGVTTDGRGVELEGIDQPLTVYVAIDALGQRFVGVEKRER